MSYSIGFEHGSGTIKDDDHVDERTKELRHILPPLHSLFISSPEILITLSEIVDPQMPNEYRYSIIAGMFVLVNLSQAFSDPPASPSAKMLRDIKQLFDVLGAFSRQALFTLSSHLTPPDRPLFIIQSLQQYLRDCRDLQHMLATVAQSQVHLRRRTLLQYEPSLNNRMELLALLADLFILGDTEFI